jgi:hypothetical protein
MHEEPRYYDVGKFPESPYKKLLQTAQTLNLLLAGIILGQLALIALLITK